MGASNYRMDYTVDMVFCIDATGSMEDDTGRQDKIINMVKRNALNFYDDFCKEMAKEHKPVQQLRVRVVAFRDYLEDREKAMLVTNFYLLPQQSAEFEACIRSIHAEGGGDIPEDGLEALAYAIKSQWATTGMKKRQVIVVWTDAGTHELGFGRAAPNYPKRMPANMAELSRWWYDDTLISQKAKRLVLFAPNEPGWSYISDNWDNVVHCTSEAGNGLAEQDYSSILNTVARTV